MTPKAIDTIEELEKLLHKRGWSVFIEGKGYLEGNKWWTIKTIAMGSIWPKVIEKKGENLTQVIQEVLAELGDDE